ncbi:thiolase domain-containing protein [Candidatus Gottesmanbacteria bacterium]|nr:thiolase domain-containing protein [Candidatus Gottesmanbacteria bacterium]
MVSIIGASTTKFGELWGTSPRQLAREAVEGALADAGIDQKKVDALFVANMLAGPLAGQQHLGPFFAEELGLHVPAFTIEGACASGGLAVHAAVNAITSGQYEIMVVLGVEKMTDHKPEDVATALMGAGSDEERLSGATFPGLYALLARSHMEKFGTTQEELASIAVKNHFHASLNTNAQFHNTLTVEDVMKSSKVADPITLLECSPISDGAAAVVLTKSRKGVRIVASEVATDTLGLAQRKSLTQLLATQEAASHAYKKAGVGPNDIDVAEVHDCFTIAEILAMEDLGFYKKGKAARAIARGETSLPDSGNPRDSRNRRLVVNPSGGLKGCGHPVAATGIKQMVELVHQLRGTAGKRQVAGARVGLAQNVGGSGATAVVHILKKNYDLRFTN